MATQVGQAEPADTTAGSRQNGPATSSSASQAPSPTPRPPQQPAVTVAPPPPPAAVPIPPPAPTTSVATPKPPKAPALPTSPIVSDRPGYQPDSEKLSAAYVLAMLLVLLGLFSVVPGVLDVVRYLRDTESGFVGRWAFVVFFLATLHFGYAFYLGQLPDWSSSWVLTAATLAQGAVYGATLTALYLAGGGSQFVQMLELQSYVDNGHARAWCFVMVCVTGVVAYFCGRVSMRWRRAFILVRDAHRRGY